jgi:hypothetical protein
LLITVQEYAMAATQKPQQSDADADEPFDGQPPPIPDEDGPHDVPDDEVIRETLPKAPGAGGGRQK